VWDLADAALSDDGFRTYKATRLRVGKLWSHA